MADLAEVILDINAVKQQIVRSLEWFQDLHPTVELTVDIETHRIEFIGRPPGVRYEVHAQGRVLT